MYNVIDAKMAALMESSKNIEKIQEANDYDMRS